MATTIKQPTKGAIHAWLYAQVRKQVPPPSPEEIRRQLGWKLVQKAN